MKNKITVTGANITFFSFAMAYILFTILMLFPTLIFGKDFASDNFAVITLISEYVIILGPVFVYVFIKKLSIREIFRLNNPGFLPMVIILLTVIPASLAGEAFNMLIVYPLSLIGKLPETPIPVPHTINDLLLMLFVIGVTPGICEEILNRGIFLKAYEKRGTVKAIVISAIFFGLFHFDIQNLFGPIFLGLLMGYYVARTNSIFSSMFAHFLNNSFAVLCLYWARNEQPQQSSRITFEQFGITMLRGAIAFAIVIVLMLLFTKLTEKKSTFQPSISGVGSDIKSVVSHWPIIVILSMYFCFTCLIVLAVLVS
ncbi:MAG: type II CAAX endopeptidase family protein [Bacillota bacterium]|nr:type II CAAX endopeptidase family protein [Bacillota bacterium]